MTRRDRRRTGRRTFLGGLGAGALAAGIAGASPLLGALQRRLRPSSRAIASAATGGRAKRLVVFFTPNGTVHRHWRPRGGRHDFVLPDEGILGPLAAFRDVLNVLEVDFRGANNHEGGMAAMLTGNGAAAHESGGASIDQVVAHAIGTDTPFRSLELGVQTSAWGGNVQTRMSYAGPGAYVPPDDRPAEVHRRVFAGVGSGAAPAEVDALAARRGSVLDLVRAELGDLHRRAPASQRPKLDAHLGALRAAESTLMTPGAAGDCDAPAVMMADPMANDSFPLVGRAQTDLMVAALACGLTRVASLQWSHTVGPPVFSWLGISEGHHSLSHIDDGNPTGIANFVAAERWYAEQFAYLLERLDTLPDPEGEGSMLDHTLVVWAQELGDGRLHVCEDVPWILAGAAGGFLRTGQYLPLGGTSHTKLLVTIANAMGLETRTFGDPAYGTGPIEELVA